MLIWHRDTVCTMVANCSCPTSTFPFPAWLPLMQHCGCDRLMLILYAVPLPDNAHTIQELNILASRGNESALTIFATGVCCTTD